MDQASMEHSGWNLTASISQYRSPVKPIVFMVRKPHTDWPAFNRIFATPFSRRIIPSADDQHRQ
ncbi:hypothetical protein RBSH_01421 [Rhodopirellula baltica SH28]|uniref:Uncharacterized protein n=1 Tax=Rhodopirellula baltica SH28 TaxID=993517 RepID=K5D969_RHOBT|nr:hypothetical protein RBSH_01421 [Rhodopirellula baltica SH28]